MALAKLSSLYERISGRVGESDVVNSFSGGAQPIIRNFVFPVQPGSADQIAARAIFSAATKRWQTLTEVQRDAWDSWAVTHPATNRFGVEVQRTGLSAYVELNSIQYMRTGAFIDPAPTLQRPTSPTNVRELGWAPGGSGLFYTIDHTYSTTTGLFLLTKMTAAINSPAITPRVSAFRMWVGVGPASFEALPDTAGQPGTLTPKYIPAADGELFGIWAQIVNAEGWASPEFRTVLEVDFI